MITINSGKLSIPEEEFIIGFAGDSLNLKKQFKLENFSDTNCVHSLCLKFNEDTITDLILDSKVENGSTILTWDISKEHILKFGLIKAQIKSVFKSGKTSHTSWDYFYVHPSNEYSEKFENIDISDFFDYKEKINEVYDKISNTDFSSLVSTDRTIAGISLADNIDASKLCEALKVYPTVLKEGAPDASDVYDTKFLIDTLNNDLYYCDNANQQNNNWIKLTGNVDNINSIENAQINESGELVLTFSDDTTSSVGVVVGKDGVNGVNGTDGEDGYTPVKGVDYYTQEDKNELKTYIANEVTKRNQLKPEFANSVEECTDTSMLYVLPDGFIYAYMTVENVGGTEEVTEQITGDFTEDYRLSTSSGSLSALSGAISTPLIDITEYGDKFTIHLCSANGGSSNTVKWANANQDTTGNSMCLYKDGSFLMGGYTGSTKINGITYVVNSVDDVDITFDTSAVPSAAQGFTHVRFSGVTGRADQVNVSVTYEQETQIITETKWTNTGHAFVPADYEDRIIDVENDVATLKANGTELSGIPSYVLEEAEEVADKVITLRNAHSFVFGAFSDSHTTGEDTSKDSIVHAGMGMDAINALTQLDLVLNFGDVMVGYLDDTYKEGFKHVKSAFNSVSKAVPYIQMQGNHDQIATDTTAQAQQKYFAYIGSNNIDTVTDWDNRFRNYGYRDFDDQKMRVIYLNTADVSEAENTKDVWITAQQCSWLINTALDFSAKENAESWGFIVCSHHPLNWYYLDNLLTILDAYKGKESGNITADDLSVSYDFSDSTAELIAHFHGHLHNFRAETLGSYNVTTITIPNACFDRNNEYGSNADSEVRELFGDTDESSVQRIFNKTSSTADDTAFNVVVLDRDNRKIHCINYGAGIDREIAY